MYDNNEYQINKERRINRLACDKVAQEIMATCLKYNIGDKPTTRVDYIFRLKQVSSELNKVNYPEK